MSLAAFLKPVQGRTSAKYPYAVDLEQERPSFLALQGILDDSSSSEADPLDDSVQDAGSLSGRDTQERVREILSSRG